MSIELVMLRNFLILRKIFSILCDRKNNRISVQTRNQIPYFAFCFPQSVQISNHLLEICLWKMFLGKHLTKCLFLVFRCIKHLLQLKVWLQMSRFHRWHQFISEHLLTLTTWANSSSILRQLNCPNMSTCNLVLSSCYLLASES